jgi:hypothetical protein
VSKTFTDEQIRAALVEAGGVKPAAKLLGCNRNSLQKRLARMRNAGIELPTSTVYPVMPAGQRLRGVSTLLKITDPITGEPQVQWVKTREDATQVETALRTVLDAMKDEVPREPARPLPGKSINEAANARLASLVTITDYHMGMYSWAEETGDDWDLTIAENMLVEWFRLALEQCPSSHLGILAQLGDFLHYDSLDAVTPRSGHNLDADSRAQKMIRVGIRVLRRIIGMMLDKFVEVRVLMAEGNHDPIGSAWLRETFRLYYENEPRVTVDDSPDPYYAVQWGAIGLFFHHGHLKKAEQLDRVFARKFRSIYGESTRCYGHCGHLHHKVVMETSLMHIEQHPTLAAADAYASRSGFLSDRGAAIITYDKEYGEVGRVSVTPDMVRARQH